MHHFKKSFFSMTENTNFYSVVCQVCQQKSVLPGLAIYPEMKKPKIASSPSKLLAHFSVDCKASCCFFQDFTVFGHRQIQPVSNYANSP